MALANAEGLLIELLSQHPALTSALVCGELPAEKYWPAMRVVRTGGSMAVERVLDSPVIQVDVWAETKVQAFDLATVACDVIESMAGLHQGVFSTGSEIELVRYDPDETFDPAMPRYIVSAQVWARAL